MMKIGLTTTIPVEIVFAAKFVPVDLNNVFITDENKKSMIEEAEKYGFPRNTCAWIKGIFSAAKKEGIKKIIFANDGDCSNGKALSEVLESEGFEIIPFSYPYDRDKKILAYQIEKLAHALGTTIQNAEEIREELIPIRSALNKIDEETFLGGKVTGKENHLFLVSSSDFEGDYKKFGEKVFSFLQSLELRTPDLREKKRLAFIGVPPIFDNIYDLIEAMGGRVVFNEVQRQFMMPFDSTNLIDQYAYYSYPYNFALRLEDIKKEIKKRKVDGVIHYTQTFCHHQIEDILLRKSLSMPILSVEGDKPSKVDARTKLRIESFFETIF